MFPWRTNINILSREVEGLARWNPATNIIVHLLFLYGAKSCSIFIKLLRDERIKNFSDAFSARGLFSSAFIFIIFELWGKIKNNKNKLI